MDHSSFLGWMSEACSGQRIDWLLVGGWALGAYGVSRETVDLDLLICEDDFPIVRPLLETHAYRVVYRSSLFARFGSDHDRYPELDVLFVARSTMDALLADSRPYGLAGVSVRVPSLNHLIGMKWHALKQDRRARLGKDLLDIVSLVSANRIDVRSAEFRELSLKYACEDLYRHLLLLTDPPGDGPP